MRLQALGQSVLAAGAMAGSVGGAPPTPDHVVVVVEENHSYDAVIGSASAPFINQLAQQGALLTSMYGLTHPSQPNYLEFYSGFNQGFIDNSEPTAIPFATPNLGASLIAAGVTFAGFSDGLPGEGSLVWTSGAYARRHVPWTNWQSPTPGPNQVPATVNRPFTAFPSDFSLLPRVSVVIPDNNHNMHDGTVADADAWLQANIGAYASWAMTHNSLLIVTWDEDGSDARNRIPTVLYGPMVRPGVNNSVWTLHNLQRTIADMHSATPSGSAADVQAITGVWAGDGSRRSVRFRQGVGGYAGTRDTFIETANASVSHAADAKLVADGSPVSQGLIRFDGVFGAARTLVVPGASIVSAKVMILTGDATSDNSASRMSIHRMLSDWSDTSTWNSMANGVSPDGVECAAVAEFALNPSALNTWTVFDVTGSVQAWAASPDPNGINHGWAILPGGTDGWRFISSDSPIMDDRPMLEVTYLVTCPPDFNASGTLTVQDIFDFLSAWLSADPGADFDGGGLSVQDIFQFLIAWFAGC